MNLGAMRSRFSSSVDEAGDWWSHYLADDGVVSVYSPITRTTFCLVTTRLESILLAFIVGLPKYYFKLKLFVGAASAAELKALACFSRA